MMELKYTNSNGEIVLASKLNHMEPFFWKIINIELKKKFNTLFSQKATIISWKTRWFVTFTSLIQMKQIKAFHVEKNII